MLDLKINVQLSTVATYWYQYRLISTLFRSKLKLHRYKLMSSSDSKDANAKNATTAMGYFWKTREMLTPTLKQTAFLTKGILTPDEFVRAGDELVYRCPTWSWCSGGIGPKSYLPPDKQFLITRNVPCRDRVAALERSTIDMLLQEQNTSTGESASMMDDWIVSSIPGHSTITDQNFEDDFDVLDDDGEVVPPVGQSRRDDLASELQGNVIDEEYADMAEFEDNNILVDDDNATVVPQTAALEVENSDHIVKVRTYDLSITYDNYYRTPRIWMTGKSASGHPLTAKETMEDVITDYANKTVTMEAHPHLSGPHASIHPCKHGAVMKTIVRNLVSMTKVEYGDVEKDAGPAVEVYLFIFLKFVSSIIPTINYDFTMDVTANTVK
jgi:ubiquitin-like-conjugating enzyme ATG3